MIRFYFRIITFIGIASVFFLKDQQAWAQCTPNQVVEAVSNGDFENGYLTSATSGGFSSDLSYVGNFVPNCSVSTCCHWDIGNQFAVARAESAATIGSACTSNNRQTYAGTDYINIAGGFTDHTPGKGGNGFALIGDFEGFAGSKWDTSPSGLPAVWRQQVTIQANQKYYFSAWFANYNRDASLGTYVTPTLNFIVVPMIGSTPQWAQRANLGNATPTGQMSWQQFSGQWIPGAAYTSAMLLIEVQAAGSTNMNDLAIDDISFINGCDNLTSLPSAYQPDLGPDFSLCTVNGAATLNSNVTSSATNAFWWYEGTGTTQTALVSNSSTQYTYNITTPGTYRVCVQNAGFPSGCSSSSTIVVTNTMLPVTLDDQNICTASTVTLTAKLPSGATYSGSGLTYTWTVPSGAPASVNSPTYTTGVTGTYKVKIDPGAGAAAAGCTSVTSNNASVTTSLVTPSFVSGDCSSNPKSFTMSSTTGGGNTYGWYDAATGGNLKATGNPATITYTAAQVPTVVYLENYNTYTVGPTQASATGNGAGASDRQETDFTALQNFTLVSFYVKSAASTGTVTVSLTKDGSPVSGTTATATSSTSTWVPITVNWPIQAGSTYKINISGGGWLQVKDPFSSTTYSGIVTINPNIYSNSGSAIQWTIRTGSACMRTPFTIDCALPVDYISFTALKSGENVFLSWRTGMEKDASTFYIERSTNGVDFETVGQKEAQNISSGASYKYNDYNVPQQGLYYRLLEKDINGNVYYSPVRYVVSHQNLTLLLFPNPAQNELTLMLPNNGEKSENGSVQLYNMIGQEVIHRNTSGESLSQGEQLDLSLLPSGTYLVRVIVGQIELKERLVKD